MYQRAKMKELAKQRTKQLQEEEEERARKQKAKALAKLDELNKRTQVVEGSTQKENSISSLLNKTEELQSSESTNVSGKSGAANSAIVCSTNVVCQMSETSIDKVETPPILSCEPTLETLDAGKESVIGHQQSVTSHQDVNSAETKSAIQVQNNIAAKQKRVGYKQKQILPLNEKISVTMAAPKVENGTVVDVTVSAGIVTNEVNSDGGSSSPMNSTAMAESSVNQKKKNNKNGKNKHEVEETSGLAALPLATTKEASSGRSSVESDKPKASNFELDQNSVQPTSFSKDPNQYPEQRRILPNEESHGRLNSQWKPQHSRRMPRNMQANRPSEKSHGNDAVVWAPVKPQNKMEIMDDSSDKSKIETVNPVKGDQKVPSNLRNKRAEMERYIPKPAAKEIAQQGSVQQMALSINETATDEFIGRVGSGSQGSLISRQSSSSVEKVATGMESKSGDGRQTKQGKAHGSWRQRGSTESTNVHDAQEGLNSDLNNDQSLQSSTEHQQAQKPEMSSVKGQTKHVNDSTDPDGSNNNNNQDSAAQVSIPAIRDQAATGRGRRGPFRGHKGMGMNHDIDHKKHGVEAEKVELLISSSEPGQPDVGAASKENRGVGERSMSHWQPKSQASSNQRGSRPNDGNVGSETSQFIKKGSSHGSLSPAAGCDKETNAHVNQPQHNQSVSEMGKAEEATNIGNQEARRVRKNALPKGRSHSPSQVIVEPSPTSVDFRHEQRPSSGFRKNGNQNRFGRGHESRGDWTSSGHDNRHYKQAMNRDRQGHNLQYEYHPVGPYDNSKSDVSERPKDGNHNGGRYREKTQTHSRRGNFYGRQAGSFD